MCPGAPISALFVLRKVRQGSVVGFYSLNRMTRRVEARSEFFEESTCNTQQNKSPITRSNSMTNESIFNWLLGKYFKYITFRADVSSHPISCSIWMHGSSWLSNYRRSFVNNAVQAANPMGELTTVGKKLRTSQADYAILTALSP